MAATVVDRFVATLGWLHDSKGLDKFNRGIQGVRGKLDSFAGGAARIGAVVTGALGVVAAKLVTFESAFNELGAVFLTETGENMAKLRAQAEELGRTTAKSATDAVRAQTELARSGLTLQQVLDATPATLALAVAGQLDMAEAAQLTAAAIQSYGFEADDAGRVTDAFALLAARSAFTVRGIGPAFRQAGALAASAGVDFEQSLAALGVLRTGGLIPEQAGTALRNIIAIMSEDPSDKVAKGFEALGLNFEDFRQRFAETGDIVGLFQTLKTAGLDTASALAIFGREAGAGAIILANNADKVGELQVALEDSGGAAQAMADRQLVGLPGALELLRSAAEGVVLALGASGLTAILTRAAEIATDFARAISEAPEWVQRLISGALLLGPALLGIAAAAKGLSFVLGGLQILMGPAGLIIAGIAALVLGAVLLVKHWDKVVAFFERNFAGIGRVFAQTVDQIKGAIGRIIEVVRQIFGGELSLLDVGRQMIQGLIAGIAGRIQSVIDSFKRIIGAIVGIFTGDTTIAEAAKAVVGALVDVWKAVTPDLALFRWIQDSVEGAIGGVIDWISGLNVASFGSGIVGQFIGGIVERIGDAVAAVSSLWATIKAVFVTGEADLGELARAAWDAVVAVFSASPIGLLLTALTEGWERIREWVAGINLQGEGASVIGSFIAGVVGRVQDVFDAFAGLWDAIKATFVTGEMELGDLARAVWSAIVAVFRASPAVQLFDWIAPKLSEAWESLKARAAGIDLEGMGAGLLDRLIVGIVERVSAVVDAFTGLWDAIIGAFGTGEATLADVATGIWNAIVAVFRVTPAGLFFDWLAPKLAAAWDNALAAIAERGGLFASIGQGFEEDATLQAIVALWDKAKAAIAERGGLFASIGQGLEDDAILQGIVGMWDKAVTAIQERGGLWQAILQGLRDDPILQELILEFKAIGEFLMEALVAGIRAFAGSVINPIKEFFGGGEGEDGERRPGLLGRIFGGGGAQVADALPVGPAPPAAGAQGTGAGTTIINATINIPLTLTGDTTPEQAAAISRAAGTAAGDALKEQLRSAAEQSDTNQRA